MNQFPLGAICPRVDKPGSSSLGKIPPSLSNLILVIKLHSEGPSKSNHCPQQKNFKLLNETPKTLTYLVPAYLFNSFSLRTIYSRCFNNWTFSHLSGQNQKHWILCIDWAQLFVLFSVVQLMSLTQLHSAGGCKFPADMFGVSVSCCLSSSFLLIFHSIEFLHVTSILQQDFLDCLSVW